MQTFSLRLPADLHRCLREIAAARRETPAELARSLIGQSLHRAKQLDDEENKPTKKQKRDVELTARVAQAAIFAELMLKHFGHEDKANTERLLQRAKEEAAMLLGKKPTVSPEAAEESFAEEQRAVAQRLAAG